MIPWIDILLILIITLFLLVPFIRDLLRSYLLRSWWQNQTRTEPERRETGARDYWHDYVDLRRDR